MLSAETTAPDTAVTTAPLPLPVPLPAPDLFTPPPVGVSRRRQQVMAVLTAVVTVGAIVGIGAIHGSWAYGDWTCAFKNCVAVAPVRRRRRKR